MSLKERIDQDIKTALLAGDKERAMTLRGLKNVILNAEIETRKKDTGLSDDEIVAVLQKESKKRQESAELYGRGGSEERAAAELAEKEIIASYLPRQLSEAEIAAIVDKTINESSATDQQAMGQVIGQVRQQLGIRADGAVIARLVKERLS